MEDDCQAKHPDECATILSLADDDSCPNGKNVGYSTSANGGGMIGVLAIGVQVMNVQLGRMKMTSAFLQKTLMVRLMSAQGGVRR